MVYLPPSSPPPRNAVLSSGLARLSAPCVGLVSVQLALGLTAAGIPRVLRSLMRVFCETLDELLRLGFNLQRRVVRDGEAAKNTHPGEPCQTRSRGKQGPLVAVNVCVWPRIRGVPSSGVGEET